LKFNTYPEGSVDEAPPNEGSQDVRAFHPLDAPVDPPPANRIIKSPPVNVYPAVTVKHKSQSPTTVFPLLKAAESPTIVEYTSFVGVAKAIDAKAGGADKTETVSKQI
jgi:hypothetical protein